MKPAHAVTDRAKRYRANRNPPPGPKRCTFCASRKNIDIDHVDGDESDDTPANKMYLCRPCNTAKGIVQARNRIGVRTAQFNPSLFFGRRIPTFAQFRHSAAVLLGVAPGNAGEATELVKRIPPEKRAEYSERIEHENRKNPLFAPQAGIDRRKFRDVAYGLEVDVTGRGAWVEQGLYPTLREAESDGRKIKKREGMDYRVKVTRDRRNPAKPTYAQYGLAVAMHRRGAHDEGGAIIHATPPALRHKYALQIARTKRERR